MTKQEIIDRFYQENPDVTSRVISQTILESWAEIGNIEIATRTRAIRKEITFNSVIDQQIYNLVTQEAMFYDIDEFPGGGIVYDNRRLKVKTVGLIDDERTDWRTQTSGRPYDYFRYNDTITLGRKPSSIKAIIAYLVVNPEDFDNNNLLPFNELAYLKPFHYSLVLYLTMRAKHKISKDQDSGMAKQEYGDYLTWMKTEINRGIYHEIKMRPASIGIRSSINRR